MGPYQSPDCDVSLRGWWFRSGTHSRPREALADWGAYLNFDAGAGHKRFAYDWRCASGLRGWVNERMN